MASFYEAFGVDPETADQPAAGVKPAKGAKPAPTGASKQAIPVDEDQSSTWTDHLYDLGSKVVRTGADLANTTRLGLDAAGYKGAADTVGDYADQAYGYSDDLANQLSEKGKKNRDAKILDTGPDAAINRPKGSQAISALNSTLPSMGAMAAGAEAGAAIGSIVPGVGTAIGGVVGAGAGLLGTSTALELGSINRSIYDELKKSTPEELQASPRYQELIQSGNTPQRALRTLADETGRAWQLGGAALAGSLDLLGPVSGKIMSLAGRKAIPKSSLIGGTVKEMAQEGAQSGVENVAKQGGMNESWGTGFDGADLAEDVAKGAVSAGPMGAGSHFVGGHKPAPQQSRDPINADQNAALEGQNGGTPEAIDTGAGAMADRVMERGKQAAQPAPPPAAAPPVTEGPVPQREAIPTGPVQGPPQRNAMPLNPISDQAPQQGQYGAGGTPGRMYGDDQIFMQGQPVNAPYAPQQGPASQVGRGPDNASLYVNGNPVMDQQGAQQPVSAQPTSPRAPSDTLAVMPFLQSMADENNGVVDPARIAAYLSSRGQTATSNEVVQELIPLVQQGILQQTTIPGNNGQPMFRMATERQGPAAPAQGPAQQDQVHGPQPQEQGPHQPVGPQPQEQGPQQPVGPQQPYGPYVPHDQPQAPAIRPLGNAERQSAQEGPGLFDQGDLFGNIPEQKPAAAPNPDTMPGHLAGQGELDLHAPEQQGDLPLAPGRPQAHQRRAAAEAGPKGQKLKALAARKKAEKKAPVAAEPATAPIPADATVRVVGANAEAAKGQIGAALEKYLPGKKPPPPPAAPAAPVAKAKPKTVKLYRGEPVHQASPKARSHPGVFFYGEKDKAKAKGYTRAVQDNSKVGSVREVNAPAEMMSRLADLNNDAQYNELVPKKSERSQKHTRGVMPTESMVENLRKKGLKGFRWTDDMGQEQIFLIPEVAEGLKYEPLPEAEKPAAPAKAAAIKAKSKARTAAVSAPVEVKAEAAVPTTPAKAPVLERRVERQILRTQQKIETSNAPAVVKGKWQRGLQSLQAQLAGMRAQRINAPFDAEGHNRKVAGLSERATAESVRVQQAADRAAAAATAHGQAIAKLNDAQENLRSYRERPNPSKGEVTKRTAALVKARKAEAEARAANEEAAKEHRRASVLFEGRRAEMGVASEGVPPLPAQYAGKYRPEDAKVESEWSPDDQPVQSPAPANRAKDLLGDKDQLAAARAEVRAAKFAETADGLRRRLEALEDTKENKAQRAELSRQLKDMEYAAELAHERAEDLRQRADKTPEPQGKPISDQEVLKRVTKRFEQSRGVQETAQQHGLSVDDMVSLVMSDIKRELEGKQNTAAVENLPFTELMNRAHTRAKKLGRLENRGGALDMMRQERARVNRGESIRYDTHEDMEASREAEREAMRADEMSPANPDPDARFSHGLPRYMINEDGEIVENPVRRAADEQQNPNREMEHAAKIAETAEARAERMQGYLAKSGLGSSADQTKMSRSRASQRNGFRAAMAGFLNENGKPKKWEHIAKAVNRIYDEYRGAGKEVPDIVRDIRLHNNDVAQRVAASGNVKARPTRAELAERQKLLDRLQDGEWDKVASQTFTAAREAAVARTPISVFESHAPEGGNSLQAIADESLADQVDRLNGMVKDFVALQNSGFNMDGQQARSGSVKGDKYLGLMRDLIRMTEGGRKPLAYTEVPLKEGAVFNKSAVEERNKRFRAKHEVQALLSAERTLRSGDEQNARFSSEQGASFEDNMDADQATGGSKWKTARRMASMDGLYAPANEVGAYDLGSMTGTQALDMVWPNPDPVTGGLIDALKARVGNVPVHVVTASELESMMPGRNANMFYDPDTGTIYAKPGLDAGVERAGILEELWHAATAEAIYNDPELHAMGKELQQVFLRNNPGYSDGHMRYFSELGELSAHGLLNPEFKARIDGVPLPAKLAERLGVAPKTSMLQAIFQRVLRFLGIAPKTKEASLLEGIMHWNQQLFQATRPGGGIDQAPARALASMADLPVLGSAVQAARTTASNQTPAILKTTLGLMYTTDIVQKFGGLFHWDTGKKYLRLAGATDPVHQADLATRKRAALTKRLEQADGPMLDRHRALVAQDPKTAQAMHRLMNDATTVGIDPSSPTPPARARHAGVNGRRALAQYTALNARYKALTPEARAVFDAARDSVKAKANAVARSALIDIARRRWQNAQDKGAAVPGMPAQPLSPMAEREMVERLLSGNDTFSDRQVMGEGGMAVAKDYASRLNSPTFYFPKSREGEFVVTGNRTDYKSENFFETEHEAEAFANKAEADGVPVMYDVQRTGVDAQGQRINLDQVDSTPGATIKYRVKLQTQITEMFEAKSDAVARQKEYERLPNVRISGVETRKRGKDAYVREIPPEQQAQITRAIESMASNEEDKAYLSEMLQEALVKFMPGSNMRHATIHRRNVIGASEDVLRTMGKHTVAAAQYRGSLEYGAYQRAAIQAMDDVTDTERFTARGKKENLTRLAITGELRHRQQATDADAQASNPIMRGVQRYVAVHYLASPSYALLQLTQTPLMGPGVMARLFPNASDSEIIGALGHGHTAVGGISGTFAALGKDKFVRAWQKYRDQNPQNVEFLERVKRNLAETNPGMAKEYGALLDEMARRGVIDETAGLEVSQMVKDLNAGALKKGWSLVEDLSRAFPAAAEVYNRSSVAVAAYKLARDKGMSVEQATELADQAILGIHFDYSAQNAPRLMNEANKRMGGVLSPFLTFKKYVAAVYGQMALSLVNSVRGESPEVRRAARRQFSRMMIAHGMAAGIMGLPWEPIKLGLGVAAFLMGKDEPWDFEDDIRKLLVQKLGGGPDGVKWTNVIMHGLPQLAGGDIADRVGLENLMFGRGPDDFSPAKLKEYAANLVFGAAGGAFGGILQGGKTIRDTGNIRKGAEQMAPKFIRDALAAWEMAEGGKKNAKGEDITEGLLGPQDAVWRALGFKSATEASAQRERSNRFQEMKAGTRDRSRLHKEIIAAQDKGDEAAIAAAQKKIDQHNADHPDYGITDESIKNARRNVNADPSKKYMGVPVPKGGLSPSIVIPQFSRDRIEQGREIGKAQNYAPLKEDLGSAPASRAITAASNEPEHPFFASIIRAEGTARDGDPYNEVLGYGQYGEPPKPLTEMTLREVYDFGREVRARHGSSSAMGAFQIVGKTMKAYMAEAGLDWDDYFDRDNQRKLALVIAEHQGIKPSTWEGFRNKPWLLRQARQAYQEGGFDNG